MSLNPISSPDAERCLQELRDFADGKKEELSGGMSVLKMISFTRRKIQEICGSEEALDSGLEERAVMRGLEQKMKELKALTQINPTTGYTVINLAKEVCNLIIFAQKRDYPNGNEYQIEFESIDSGRIAKATYERMATERARQRR